MATEGANKATVESQMSADLAEAMNNQLGGALNWIHERKEAAGDGWLAAGMAWVCSPSADVSTTEHEETAVLQA